MGYNPTAKRVNHTCSLVIIQAKQHATFSVNIIHQQIAFVSVVDNDTMVMLVENDVHSDSLT